MTIADRIRQKRHELQLSQTELAERAEYYDKTRISKIENSGNDISMKQVKRIAKALGVSSAYLMGWEESKSKSNPIDYVVNANINGQQVEEFIELYQSANPDVQQAVLLLLKSSKHNP